MVLTENSAASDNEQLDKTRAKAEAIQFIKNYQENGLYFRQKADELRRTVAEISNGDPISQLGVFDRLKFVDIGRMHFIKGDFTIPSRLAYQFYNAAKQVQKDYWELSLEESGKSLQKAQEVTSTNTFLGADIIDLMLLYVIWLWKYDVEEDLEGDSDAYNAMMDSLGESEQDGWETYRDEIGPYLDE